MGWLSRLFGGHGAAPDTSQRIYTLGVAGEGHKNPDGTSRQAEIKRCRDGEHVTLVAEPTNPYDPLAIAVLSARGTCIGYISRDHNEWIGTKLAAGAITSATIQAIVGGEKGKPSRGVLLAVAITKPSAI